MDLAWWVTETATRTRRHGLAGLRWGAERAYSKLLQLTSVVHPGGEPIWTLDWDLLVVVDACRYDLMTEVAGEYGFVDEVGSSTSVNSLTRLWMAENFSEEYAEQMAETAYVTGNPWSEEMIDDGAFAAVEHVWKYAWTEPGTVPPEPITDEVIRRGRAGDSERIIAHYMQPHAPFLPAPEVGPGKDLEHFGDQPHGDVWDALQRGDYTKETVWAAYRDNLRHVLDDVERLLANVDAERVVVTSDHGNAFGEWGIYGHPPDMPLDCLRTVPVVRTSAEDTGRSEPGERPERHGVDRDEQLEALGYV